MEALFELIKGLIKDIDGTPDDEVHPKIKIIISFTFSDKHCTLCLYIWLQQYLLLN